MHVKTNIFWDNEDPSFGKRIDEAFNRVISFCPELISNSEKMDRPRELISFNRIVGGDFDPSDMITLSHYATRVHAAIVERYGSRPDDPQAESVLQAGRNVVETMSEVVTYITHNLASLQWLI